MLERKGEVAYRLGLPPNLSGVHDVFHVSQLKKCLRLLEERVLLYGLDDTERSDLHRAPGEIFFWRPLRLLLRTRRQRCAECNGVTIPRR